MGPPPEVVEGAKKEEDKTEVKEKRPGVFKQGLNFRHCCRRGHKFISYMFGELLFFVGIMYFLPSVTATVASDRPKAISFTPSFTFHDWNPLFNLRIIRSQKIKLAKLAEAWLEP